MKCLCVQEPGSWLSRFEDGYIIGFAGTEHTASEYRSYIPGKYVHVGLRDDIMAGYWNWVEKQRTEKKAIPKTLFIFDDCLVLNSNKKFGVTRTDHNYWLMRIWAEGRHMGISACLCVQQLAVGLRFIRCSDVFLCMPSAFYAGQDQEMLTKNYMPCPNRKTAEWIADCFTQYEILVCEYWRQTSRAWQTRVKWFRVPGNIVTFRPNVEDGDGARDERGAGRGGGAAIPGLHPGREKRECANDAAETHQYVQAPADEGKH